MEIKYLTILRDTPARPSLRSDVYIPVIKPISWEEIVELERLYNRGNSFPAALRELLFLAGSDCYVLDYGFHQSLRELQQFVRDMMIKRLREIKRPFMVIDVYNASDQFLFVYLDDGEDPTVHEMYYEYAIPKSVTLSLSAYIAELIERAKEGRNPF